METIFRDLCVLEFANVLAGPSVGMFFSELGASVIKVENKLTGGDLTRAWKLPAEDPALPLCAYYASVNWGKESHRMDLNNTEDRKKIQEWVSKADIVISNFRKREAIKFGLTYAEIKKLNSSVIYAHITGYGEEDDRAAFDLLLQAESGFMSMNGTELTGPVKMPVAMIDIMAAHQLKEAILIALLQRMKKGTGAYVSVSLFETAISSLANQASNYLQAGHVPGLTGSLHPNIAPYGEALLCSDGKKVILAVGNDKQFLNLCKVLKAEELGTDKRFINNRERVINRVELNRLLDLAAGSWNSAQLKKELEQLGVPAGIVHNMADVFADSAAKNLILTENREGMTMKCVKSIAFHLDFGINS
ncbi:MAG: CaiB/BaiF CoA transferase family protein [Bacteroidia bacterium]